MTWLLTAVGLIIHQEDCEGSRSEDPWPTQCCFGGGYKRPPTMLITSDRLAFRLIFVLVERS